MATGTEPALVRKLVRLRAKAAALAEVADAGDVVTDPDPTQFQCVLGAVLAVATAREPRELLEALDLCRDVADDVLTGRP